MSIHIMKIQISVQIIKQTIKKIDVHSYNEDLNKCSNTNNKVTNSFFTDNNFLNTSNSQIGKNSVNFLHLSESIVIDDNIKEISECQPYSETFVINDSVVGNLKDNSRNVDIQTTFLPDDVEDNIPQYERGKLSWKEWNEQKELHLKKIDSENEIRKKQSTILNQDIKIAPYISIDRVQFDDELVNHYTGLEDWENFEYTFNILGKNANEPTSDLSPRTCFLIMLVYLKRHFNFFEMSRMFGVEESTVYKICFDWITFCYEQFKKLSIWPSINVVKDFAPSDFKKQFPSTRVIID